MSESRDDRHHRQLDELLTEIRVVLPGVQVLFAFLLSLPFLSAAAHITTAQRVAYFISFFSTTLAIALLITPSAYHRMRFQQRHKEQIIASGNRMMLTALGFLAAAMVAAVFVVTVQLLGTLDGAIVTAIAAVLFGWLWYVFPITRSAAGDRTALRGSAGDGRRKLSWAQVDDTDQPRPEGAESRRVGEGERSRARRAA